MNAPAPAAAAVSKGWTNPRERREAEAALDASCLYIHMQNGKWWRMKRNGSTRLWKRDPQRYEVPFKMGLFAYGIISKHNLVTFRIAPSVEIANNDDAGYCPDCNIAIRKEGGHLCEDCGADV